MMTQGWRVGESPCTAHSLPSLHIAATPADVLVLPDGTVMCRVRRDLVERKRDVLHVLEQYERTVKPSFAQFILPTKQFAHIIVSQS